MGNYFQLFREINHDAMCPSQFIIIKIYVVASDEIKYLRGMETLPHIKIEQGYREIKKYVEMLVVGFGKNYS